MDRGVKNEYERFYDWICDWRLSYGNFIVVTIMMKRIEEASYKFEITAGDKSQGESFEAGALYGITSAVDRAKNYMRHSPQCDHNKAQRGYTHCSCGMDDFLVEIKQLSD